jgi:nucleoid DNA-binding protein
VNTDEMSSELAARGGFRKPEVRILVDSCFECIKKAVGNAEVVGLERLGVFWRHPPKPTPFFQMHFWSPVRFPNRCYEPDRPSKPEAAQPLPPKVTRTQQQIIEDVAKATGVSIEKTKHVVLELINVTLQAVEKGDRVGFIGFGLFERKGQFDSNSKEYYLGFDSDIRY